MIGVPELQGSAAATALSSSVAERLMTDAEDVPGSASEPSRKIDMPGSANEPSTDAEDDDQTDDTETEDGTADDIDASHRCE